MGPRGNDAFVQERAGRAAVTSQAATLARMESSLRKGTLSYIHAKLPSYCCECSLKEKEGLKKVTGV